MEMNNYKLLIVDDEEDAIDVMLKRVLWDEIGFTVAGTANNGVKGIECAEAIEPDVIMTDIKMPYMDGIEMAKRLKKEFPSVKLLLLTGFDELEYAKEAIHLEVEEYLTKPLNVSELTDIFKRLKEKLDRENDEKKNTEKLRKYFDESLPLLQANFYVELIEGRLASERLTGYLSEYQIDFDSAYYCAVVLHTSKTVVPSDIDPFLLAFSVRREAENNFTEKWKAKFFEYLGNTVMLASLPNAKALSDLTDECDSFCKEMKRSLGAVVTAGIGVICSDPADLKQSYEGARDAVSYRVIYGTGRAINIREVAPKGKNAKENSDSASGQALALMGKKILLGSEDDINSAIQEWYDISLSKCSTVREYQMAVMELAGYIYKFATDNSLDAEKASGQADLYNYLPQMEKMQLKEWLTGTAHHFKEQLDLARSESTRSFVDKALDYIKEDYSEKNLSVEGMAEKLSVSGSYFQSVFKKETGKTFNNYLTDYRMKEAVRLLTETDDKNYVIAEKTGYSDANYFSYVFKKQFGVSPSVYRSQHENK